MFRCLGWFWGEGVIGAIYRATWASIRVLGFRGLGVLGLGFRREGGFRGSGFWV